MKNSNAGEDKLGVHPILAMPATLLFSSPAFGFVLVDTWDMEPFDHEMDALKLIAYYLMDTRRWLPSNDLEVTTIAAVVFEDRLRAHTDGVVRYKQGAFQRIEELSCGGMTRIERALQLAAILFRELDPR